MLLEETEIYKESEIAINALYRLEDLTGDENKGIGKAIKIMQKFDVKKACEENMIVIKVVEDGN